MMRNEKDQLLMNEVKEKLDWYINEASDEEYDEQAVASLQYLLDTLEPTGEDVDTEAAFEQFKEYVADRDAREGNTKRKPFASRAVKSEKGTIIFRYKGAMAAALVVLVLAVSLGTQAEAIKDEGFFHWIQKVVGGREFVTSPDEIGIEGVEVVKKTRYEKRDEVPEEWQAWCGLEKKIMEELDSTWEYIETLNYTSRDSIRSVYCYKEKKLIIGAEFFDDSILHQNQIFHGSDSWEEISIGNFKYDFVERINVDGKILSGLEFYDKKCKHYIWGDVDSIDIMKELIVRYRDVIK